MRWKVCFLYSSLTSSISITSVPRQMRKESTTLPAQRLTKVVMHEAMRCKRVINVQPEMYEEDDGPRGLPTFVAHLSIFTRRMPR